MSKLTLVTADFETFWSPAHTLKKVPAIQYCMHPETELISLSYKFGTDRTHCIFGEDAIREWSDRVDWSDKWLVGHNLAEFDAMLFAWRLGVRPAMWGCTLSMARPQHALNPGLSLAKLVEFYGLGRKDNHALIQTQGKHLKDFTKADLDAMRTYNIADTDQCHALLLKLLPQTSMTELRLIDMTIRMLVELQFEMDADLLRRALQEERDNKAKTLREVVRHLTGRDSAPGFEDEDMETARALLASAPKFSAFLQSQGVAVPMKLSKTTGLPTPALAKTDEEYIALQEHPNERVAIAASARLGVKSTLLEKRIEAYLSASEAVGGRLPIPLRYAGANTTIRWSGWAYNPQNPPRIQRDKAKRIIYKTSNALRMGLRAPKGYKVIVADSSGIELRINMFLWRVPYAMELFQANPGKADLYRYFAAEELYHVPIAEVTDEQRGVGKVSHLQLGFGSGAATFQASALTKGGIVIPDDEAQRIVGVYRSAHREVAVGWLQCTSALRHIHAGATGFKIDPWGMCVTTPEGIRTPRGMIYYPRLRQIKGEFVYDSPRGAKHIYGAKCDENIVQHLACYAVGCQALKIASTPLMRPYPLALMMHDELVYVVPEEIAEEALALVQSVMRAPLDWWPELVLWSEGGIGDTYGEAK